MKKGSQEDKSLPKRWNGIAQSLRFVLERDLEKLTDAIESFNDAFKLLRVGHEPKLFPNPFRALHQLEGLVKFARNSRRIPIFESPTWSTGTCLLYDFLTALLSYSPVSASTKLQLFQIPSAYNIAEGTPILSAKPDPSGYYTGYVNKLVLAARRVGESTVLLPNFFSFGLVAFPNSNGSNFIELMHEALKKSIPQNAGMHLSWEIERFRGVPYPEAFEGPSAQVAAACCSMALVDPNRQGVEPLLDEGVAVTACLGEKSATPGDWELMTSDDIQPLEQGKRQRITEVSKSSLHEKLEAAAIAGLTAVIVCRGQVPASKEDHTTNAQREEDKKTVLVQSVDTLAEAYDSLLITSQAVAAYKETICADWDKQWAPMDTPKNYGNANSSTTG